MNVRDSIASSRGWIRQVLSTPRSLEDRNIRYLYIDTAWQGVWTAGTGTFLAVFMARLGASSLMISLLTAIPALITMLVSLPASAYVERQPDHVRTTTIYRIIFRSTYLVLVLMPLFFVDHLPLLIVLLWAVQAVPAAVVNLSWTSVVGAIISPRRRPAVNGGRWALVSIVSAVLVAGFGKLLDAPWLSFPTNYQLVFFISAVTMFISVYYFSKIVMPEGQGAQTASSEPPVRDRLTELITPIVRTPAFIKFLGATFLIRLGFSMPVALYSIYWVHHLGASDTIIGLRTTVGQAALVVGYYLFGRLASRHGHRGILLLSSVGFGLYPLVTALIPSAWWLLPAAIIWGFFSGGIDISFFEGLLETTPPDKRPSFVALNQIFANLAVFVGPLLGSVLMAWLGIRAAFYIAAALHLVGAGVSWRLGVGRMETAEPVRIDAQYEPR